ncbi:hypothetical protein KBB05_04585, partial [Patescibacteria group bacterium]|nr:hypothetical protein [Patescibacteria group bacterium]
IPMSSNTEVIGIIRERTSAMRTNRCNQKSPSKQYFVELHTKDLYTNTSPPPQILWGQVDVVLLLFDDHVVPPLRHTVF